MFLHYFYFATFIFYFIIIIIILVITFYFEESEANLGFYRKEGWVPGIVEVDSTYSPWAFSIGLKHKFVFNTYCCMFV